MSNEESFPKVHVNCEKPIYINIDSNHWKYWLFDVEIFTNFDKNIILERTYGWR